MPTLNKPQSPEIQHPPEKEVDQSIEKKPKQAVEAAPEVVSETPAKQKESTEPSLSDAMQATTQATVTPAKPQKDELTQSVEEILQEDLEDLYKNLPENKKQEFKEEGEKAASIIKQMIEKGKVHGRKVISLIKKWLQIIPGVNKFFLEQESKIKADKIVEMAEEKKKSAKNKM